MSYRIRSATRARTAPRSGLGSPSTIVAASAAGRAVSWLQYRDASRRLARSAPGRFQHCDWLGAQMDTLERSELLERIDRDGGCGEGTAVCNDPVPARWSRAGDSASCRIECAHSLVDGFRQLLDALPLDATWDNLQHCASRAALTVRDAVAATAGFTVQRLEYLPLILYRFKRAHVVGRLIGSARAVPLAVTVTNRPDGLAVDEVLVGEGAVTGLFMGSVAGYFPDPEPTTATFEAFGRILPSLSIAAIQRAML